MTWIAMFSTEIPWPNRSSRIKSGGLDVPAVLTHPIPNHSLTFYMYRG